MSDERRRWRPPPMKNEEADPKVRLDEKVVRKMLQVNPAMRGGRTTAQVKRDLEGGGGAVVEKPASAVPVTSTKAELDDALAFFIRGKAEKLSAELAAVAEKKKALDEEEAAAKRVVKEQLASFIALLDEGAVAMHGVTALSKHKELLAKLDLTPAALLDAARKARK
jgi:hypothetical protein